MKNDFFFFLVYISAITVLLGIKMLIEISLLIGGHKVDIECAPSKVFIHIT